MSFKQLTVFFVTIFSLASNTIMASACDFSKGITPGPNNTFIYSEDCHLEVGHLVQDNKTKDTQIADLMKAISLKDTALSDSDKRIQLWQDTSIKMDDALTRYDALKSRNEWLFFALGVVATSAAAYTFSRISPR